MIGWIVSTITCCILDVVFICFNSYLPCVDFFSLPVLPSPSLNIIHSTSIIFGGYLTKILFLVIVVQSLSPVWLFETPWTAEQQTSLSLTISQSLPNIMAIESVMLSNHLILCHPLLLLPSVFSSIRVFAQWPGSSHRVIKILELQLQHQSFQWVFKVDFLKIDWFDLLAVQETFRSLIQHHNSKASSRRCSAFFMVQLSLLFVTTGKTTALTIWKVMSAKWCLCFLITHLGYFQLHVQKLKLKFLVKEPLSLFPGKPLVSELYCIRITAPISCLSFEDLHCIS